MSTETRAPSALWAPQRRNFTVGMILVVTLAAFEAMGLGTALPTIVAELRGEDYYSWPFTVFMAASAIATVLAGQLADRRGPGLLLLLGLPSFALGLVIAGVAPDMPTLLVARVFQGLGGGAQIVALYVMIARVYPEQDRPAAFGALSSAWVVPSLIGPAVAGFLTEYLSWRWVFLGLAPLVVLGAALLVPTVRRHGARREGAAAPGRPGLPLAAVGASAGVVALTWSAQNPSLYSLFLGAAALVVLVISVRLLVPPGTLLVRPGIPAMVFARGLAAGAFFTAQAFVPLVLSVVHHYTPSMAGVPLTVGSLGWTVGALWQSRQRERRREPIVAAGLALVGTGVCGLSLIAPAWGPHWLVFVLWFVAGTGMGIGTASTSVRVLALSPEQERGFNSSALQISDMLGQATMVGLGGVVVTALASTSAPAAGVVPLDLLLAALAGLGALLVLRSGREQTA
ncbi:MFS transporter [Saccharopolyspora taberi]|uniref:MFS transporter n=1 Tax=Saccharopolyspora taberi TaxID=60895 RepID=A0ABN3V5B1_9PSEU